LISIADNLPKLQKILKQVDVRKRYGVFKYTKNNFPAFFFLSLFLFFVVVELENGTPAFKEQ